MLYNNRYYEVIMSQEKQAEKQDKGKRFSIIEVRSKQSLLNDNLKMANKSTTSRMRLRRNSYGFRSVGGIRPMERSSLIGVDTKRPALLFFPTYQLESRHPFNPRQVENIMNRVLDATFTGHKYNTSTSPILAMTIATDLMRSVKEMHYDRYRIIAVVSLVQRRSQCYNNAVSFLWDCQRDCLADVHREECSAFLQATIFGVYLD